MVTDTTNEFPNVIDPAYARVLAASVAHRNGIYLGSGQHGAAFAPPEHGVLVLGPPRSGKTSSIVMPNVIGAAGSVVTVSTKRDVFDATHRARGQLGTCCVFDVSGSTHALPNVTQVGWSPLHGASQWDGAVLIAEAMVGASRASAHGRDGSHWNERASALLSTLFHAASLTQMSIADVTAAVNRRDADAFISTLARHDANIPCDVLSGILATDMREQSGIWSTASGVLAAYRMNAALRSAERPKFDAATFVRDQQTLYVIASSEQQQYLAPLVAGLLRDVRTAAYAHHSQLHAAPAIRQKTTPVLVVLDELANIAPLHDLPVLVAEGASQGIVTLACLQDLSQARSRWGVASDGFLSLFGTKVILGGIGDLVTLDVISRLAGQHDVPTFSKTRAQHQRFRRARVSRTISTRQQPVLPVDHIARSVGNDAIAVIGAMPKRVELTPYFSTSPWKDVVHAAPRRHEREIAFVQPTSHTNERVMRPVSVEGLQR